MEKMMTEIYGFNNVWDYQEMGHEDQRRCIAPNFRNIDEISDSIDIGPLAEWSFQTTGGGAAMPDVPDWIILAEYMAERL